MKKTFFRLFTLLLVTGTLASAAMAVFLPTGKFAGMDIRTSGLALTVDPDYSGSGIGNFQVEHPLPPVWGLYPGMEPIVDDISLRNNSDSGQKLRVTARIISGNQNWDTLKDVITLSIYSHTNQASTPVYTLAEWSQEGKELPFSVLETTTYKYQLRFGMLSAYSADPDGTGPLQAGSPVGHELMSKVTQDVSLVFEGTPLSME